MGLAPNSAERRTKEQNEGGSKSESCRVSADSGVIHTLNCCHPGLNPTHTDFVHVVAGLPDIAYSA
jgi:hypothetical protein